MLTTFRAKGGEEFGKLTLQRQVHRYLPAGHGFPFDFVLPRGRAGGAAPSSFIVPFEQPPALPVGLAPRLGLHLHPARDGSGSIRGITTRRDHSLQSHPLGGGRELDAIIERVAPPGA